MEIKIWRLLASLSKVGGATTPIYIRRGEVTISWPTPFPRRKICGVVLANTFALEFPWRDTGLIGSWEVLPIVIIIIIIIIYYLLRLIDN